MPLYEFYCGPCHAVFTFRAARVDTETVPVCPRCGAALRREVSSFAYIMRGAVQEPGSEASEGGANRMDEVAAQLTERLQAMDDDGADPREAVKVMRELASAGGLRFNKEVQEAMGRIEAGEDPEKIDETFKEVFDAENPFAEGDSDGIRRGVSWLRRLRDPARDPKWYDMPQKGDEA